VSVERWAGGGEAGGIGRREGVGGGGGRGGAAGGGGGGGLGGAGVGAGAWAMGAGGGEAAAGREEGGWGGGGGGVGGGGRGGRLTPLLAFDAQVLDLQMPFGEQRWQESPSGGHLAGRGLHQAQEVGSCRRFECRVPSPASRALPATLRVHCHGKKAGMHAGNLIVATGLSRPKEIAMPYCLQGSGHAWRFSPATPTSTQAARAQAGAIEVRSSQPGFQVHGARVPGRTVRCVGGGTGR